MMTELERRCLARVKDSPDDIDLIRAVLAEAHVAELREALLDTTASLVAATSILERGGRKAAPSNKMFEQMMLDYKKSADHARAALSGAA